MPWSAKAQELLRTQYAAVGAAGSASLPRAVAALEQAAERLDGEEQDKARRRSRPSSAAGSRTSASSSPPTGSTAGRWSRSTDLKLAPFHLLATEGHVHTDKNHVWHMETLAEVCRARPGTAAGDPVQGRGRDRPGQRGGRGSRWWTELTGRGGEGMVVKPLDFILRGKRGLAQPAVKCRGREYLRIIYGPDYTAEENLARLRSRGLGRKRSLALGEFALGIEGLERFVRREPLRRVHECVFGVLALESEPVDPRL